MLSNLNIPASLGDNHFIGELFKFGPQLRVVKRKFNIPLGRVAFLAALLKFALHGTEEVI